MPIDLNHSKNVTVEGIIIVNSNCWNLNSYSSKNVAIDNVKIISGRQTGDGFTFQSCTNHLVTNCFARTWDDSLVIKNYSGSTKGITFKNIQVWTDLAQSMEIGYETDKGMTLDPEITEVLFEGSQGLFFPDVDFKPRPKFTFPKPDRAEVESILNDRTRLRDAMPPLLKGYITIGAKLLGEPAFDYEFGSIDNVLIDGLTVINTLEGKVPRSRMSGIGEDNMITNVTLKNVKILGQPITTLKDMKLSIDEYCDGIVIE